MLLSLTQNGELMPRNGAGSYTLPEAAFQSGQTISSAKVNSDLSDIATALTQSVSRDGQTTITANQPMAGFVHTGVGNASQRNQYAAFGQVQDGNVGAQIYTALNFGGF